jgi:hypothetical protein
MNRANIIIEEIINIICYGINSPPSPSNKFHIHRGQKG